MKPSWHSGKKICLQCRRPGFDPWVRNISWRRKWKPTPGFFPGEFHGQRSLSGVAESDMTELLTLIGEYLGSLLWASLDVGLWEFVCFSSLSTILLGHNCACFNVHKSCSSFFKRLLQCALLLSCTLLVPSNRSYIRTFYPIHSYCLIIVNYGKIFSPNLLYAFKLYLWWNEYGSSLIWSLQHFTPPTPLFFYFSEKLFWSHLLLCFLIHSSNMDVPWTLAWAPVSPCSL